MSKKKLDAAQAEKEISSVADCCFLPALQDALSASHSYTVTADDLAMRVLRELGRMNANIRSQDEDDPGIELSLSNARKEVTDGLRRLAKLGFGRFVVGRRGSRTRLQFTADGHAALREHWDLDDEAGPSSIATQAPNPVPETASLANSDTIVHQFVLRPEFVVRVALPTDLSTGEASRLARFVESLPFAEATTMQR